VKEAEKVNKVAIGELAKLSKTQFTEKAIMAKQFIDEYRAASNKTTQQTEVPLTEIFYLYEGIVNYDNANVDEYLTEPATIEQLITCNTTYDAIAQAYTVSMAELNGLLLEIDLMLDYNVDDNTEIISLIDLTLESLSNNEATIRVRLTKGTDPAGSTVNSGAVFFTPSSSVWAANLMGFCNGNTTGYDAGDFLRAYANAQAPYLQLSCPAGTSKYIVITSAFDTKKVTDFQYQASQFYSVPIASGSQLWNYYTLQILPKSWYATSNQCIGHDNPDWYSRYSKLDFLIQAQLGYAVYLNPAAEFIHTDYSSKTGIFAPLPLNTNYYHSGVFNFGVVFCN